MVRNVSSTLAHFLMNRPLILMLVVGSCVFMLAINQLLDIRSTKARLEELERSGTKPHTRHPKLLEEMAVDQRRRLAATIASVQRELQRLSGTNAFIDSKWHLKLAAVAGELDPRMTLSMDSKIWDHSARLPNMRPALQVQNKPRHVCPEVYDIKNGAPYWRNNMRLENCSDIPMLKTVITALLPACNWEPGKADIVVNKIRKLYDIPIVVIVSSNDVLNNDQTNIRVIQCYEGDNESKTINNLVQSIETPFVFFGLNLVHFDRQSSLERLIRVLDDLDTVKVAGGAARDIQGHWIHGCLQVRMAYYQAYFASGYYYSKYECMYCDDILTSFVTAKSFVTDMPFSTELYGPALYRDWFAKVRENGHLVMACPDIMFYVNKHTDMQREDWLGFSKKWELQKIRSYDTMNYNFTCEEANISCEAPLEHIRSYLLPPCCAALMERYTAKLLHYGERKHLKYELHAGSVLGAVKMGSYLPWDFDMDIYYHCKDYDNWLQVETLFEEEKCKYAVGKEGVYVTLNCPHFFIELYCHDKLSAELELPEEYQNISTTIKYAGNDFRVIANPGRYCRNKMGFDDLKHAAHWRTLTLSKNAEAKGGYDNPGNWNKCKALKHHSCLDHFPGDGNLPFLEPFLLM
ncbi:hypothetical protein SK128_002664 [Halocaridina rubra]|uniref:LicD/FKTN/FKRP nucleotidyltransferase domain-containing protein n=1 Tax=Halocaridina rubra TaxID=373956 RepID=A0AAN9A8R2_HALRR